MTTQQIDSIISNYGGLLVISVMISLVGILVANAIRRTKRQPECPTPAEAVRKELAKAIAKTLETSKSKEQFLDEAGKLWDAREVLARK